MLSRPDERTLRALKSLRTDEDFSEVLAWLQISLANLDAGSRSTMDAVLLRMRQGGAQAIAEIVEYAQGKQPSAINVHGSNTARGSIP